MLRYQVSIESGTGRAHVRSHVESLLSKSRTFGLSTVRLHGLEETYAKAAVVDRNVLVFDSRVEPDRGPASVAAYEAQVMGLDVLVGELLELQARALLPSHE